ncbi:MAG: PQQ-like beta-propeller repeat protein [Acidobacteriota bacterium]|jgi:outer membrane protein assembly factor BamB
MFYKLARIALLTAAATCIVPAAAEPSSTDWPQFRGIHRNGISAETGLLEEWPEGGPAEVWRIPIGQGFSGIAVVGDRLYTMFAATAEAPSEFAAAFDARTGKELWRTPVGKRFDDQFGNGPRSTPTVHGDTVFVMSSRGNVAALDRETGNLRWGLDLGQAFGSKIPRWGFSPSALVDGEKVILEAGAPDGKSYVALDRGTGKVLWTTGETQSMGYSSPLAVEIGGQRQYVGVVPYRLRALDPSGKEIWSQDWPRGETIAMPVFVPPDRIFLSGAEGVGAHLLQIEVEEGKARAQEVWSEPSFRNHFSSSVVDGDHIYGFDNATLKCIGLADASLAWAKRGFGKGSLIAADGHLYILADNGKLMLVRATPEAYREVGSVQALEGRSWTSPTLSGGRIYLRNLSEMVAYDVKG